MLSLNRRTIVLLLLFLSLSAFAQITRQPYLQMPTPSSMTVRWQSETGDIGQFCYGTTVSSLATTVVESKDERIYHEVTVTGLHPGTKYFYSVDGSRKGKEDQYFVTAPPVGSRTPIRLWVISDFGQTNSRQNPRRLQTVAQWKSFNHDDLHADMVLSLGDQTEDDARFQLQHNYFDPLEHVLRCSPLFTTVGNHDFHDSAYNYVRTFTLPANGEAGGVPSGTELFYSFNYANLHVVVLCTEIEDDPGMQAEAEWLKKDLEQNRQEWLIACLHRPFHSGGYHPTDEDDPTDDAQKRRTRWLTVLEEHGVDLVLQGHNHVYERSYLLDNLIGKSTTVKTSNNIDTSNGREDGDGPYRKKAGVPHQGTVFVSVAAGGVANPANKHHIYPIFPVSFAGSDYEGSVAIDISGDRMDVNFLCDEQDAKGSHVWDHFTMLKTH